MANQELYNKTYDIPPEILKSINATLVANPNGEGVKRAKFMLKNGSVTYQAMKRLKNYFDTFDPRNGDATQYALAGGKSMKAYIDTALGADRHAVQSGKNVKRDMTTNPNSDLKAFQSPQLNEEKKKEKSENAVAVIVNSDNKILLLKRGEGAPWMPNKWSLVGGGIEKGETPEEAVKREIREETDLDIDKFTESFRIERHSDSIEYIFACRYNGESTDVELDTSENSNYGWYDVNEMEFLDTVPHLVEYITLVFKKYE